MQNSWFKAFTKSGVVLTLASASLTAEAATVYLTTTEVAAENALISSLLTSAGHTVTVGAAWHQLDGSQALSGYDAVVLTNNYNWSAGQMINAGQSALVNYVSNGGGLVTTEWLIWRIAASSPSYSTLAAAMPVTSTGAYNGTTNTTYSQNVADSTINAGMPNSFSFTLGSISGTETQFTTVKPGASVFYSSSNGGGLANAAGLVGWDYGNGRVISFSTLAGQTELGDANYARLFQNSVDWAVKPVPVPAAFWLFGSALLGFCSRAFARNKA